MAAGLANLPLWWTVAFTLSCSFGFLLVGHAFGHRLRVQAESRCRLGHAEVNGASAAIFVMIGVLMFL